MFTNRIVRFAVLAFFSIVLFSACGSEWDAVSKKGNTWEYQLTKDGNKTSVLTKVKDRYKLGKKTFAEVVMDENLAKDMTVVYSWNDKDKVLTWAGRSSRFGDGKTQFFVSEQQIGKLEGKKGEAVKSPDGCEVTYLGEEKVKVPAGEFNAMKFTRKRSEPPVDQTFWYVKGKGFAKLMDNTQGSMELVKFTQGKGGDDTVLGSKEGGEAGFKLVANFFNTCKTSGSVDEVLKLFSKAGAADANSKTASLRMLVDRIKTHGKDHTATIYFEGDDSFGLRFRYYDEAGGEPNVFRADVMLTVEKEGKEYKIKSFSVKYAKLIS